MGAIISFVLVCIRLQAEDGKESMLKIKDD